ncbi:hypothetical protein BJ944DRAFT_252396 [Cunninghamella echinulata]|nr:hypothetical protein BJ944DRAFT_252396 [Cunninghamella echinulata]
MPTFKRHPCPICHTTKYKPTSESHFVCKNGHQMAGYVREEADMEAFLGVRGLKRKTKNLEEEKKYIRGSELEDVLKRIFQYGLQVMARTFVIEFGFPADFEYVLRELWLLYTTSSNVLLLNAYDLTVTQPKKEIYLNIDNDVNNLLYETDSDTEDDSDSDSSDNDEHVGQLADTKDPAIIMNGEMDRDEDDLDTAISWPRLRFKHLLVFCYLACMQLGWPVMLSDIHRWCATLRLPYLSILEQIPDGAIDLLDLRYLVPTLSLPKLHTLRSDTRHFGRAFEEQCGLVFPKVNAPLIIYRYCTQMFLPVEMYFCARTMYEIFPYGKQYEFMRYNFNYHYIDLHIMTIILALVKMCYGLDDQQYELKYENPEIPLPLPKHMWLKYIRANIKRWNELCAKKYIDSPDLELALMTNYLEYGIGSVKSTNSKKQWKNVVRGYISKIQRDVGSTNKSETAWMGDLFGDISQLSDTLLNVDVNSDNNTHHDDNTIRIIGEKYLRYSRKYKSKLKVYPEEYEMVLSLASRITGCKVRRLHTYLVEYDSCLEGYYNKTLLSC